jgi:DNA-3-methyladenine glycosylase I
MELRFCLELENGKVALSKIIPCELSCNMSRKSKESNMEYGYATRPITSGRMSPESRDTVHRCPWAEGDPLMEAYHDTEWGVPEYDSRALWEKLMLDGFQAGLSWSIILHKRDAFRKAFKNFEPGKVARFGPTDVRRLLGDPGIVRSRAKIEATISGARAFLAMAEAGLDFSNFVWGLAGGKPIQNTGKVPTQTPLSVKLSKELRARGFKFVGPVIVYAWMQAVGIVNDHAVSCFRRKAVQKQKSR